MLVSERIDLAMLELPEQLRTLLRRFDVIGQTLQEIASLKGIHPRAVSRMLALARRSLRQASEMRPAAGPPSPVTPSTSTRDC